MQTVALEQFLPDVFLNCQGVSEPAALNAVRNACFDLCRKSLVWTERLEPALFIVEENTYQLVLPPETTVVSVVSVLSGGLFLRPLALDSLDRLHPDWVDATGTPAGYMRISSDHLMFVPTPDKVAAFTATVALAPSLRATVVGKDVADLHRETVIHGAVAKLKFISGHPFSDPAAAAYHKDLFVSGIQSATTNRNRSGGRSQVRVSPQHFI